MTTPDVEREMDALEFVGRLYTDATRFARSYEYGRERRTFRDWYTEFQEWLGYMRPAPRP